MRAVTTEPGYRRRAQELSAAPAVEDGCRAVVDSVEQRLAARVDQSREAARGE